MYDVLFQKRAKILIVKYLRTFKAFVFVCEIIEKFNLLATF
jgi:hypothetical protein